jgi:ABC-2 type transport system permease protein
MRANLHAALEYRASFAGEVFAMLINDAMWLSFWVAFYDRFPAVHGWQRAQVVSMWAVVATSFGLATAVFGNLLRLAGIIARGELDFFLALPRPVLLHVLIGRMSLSAFGDVLFGVMAFALLARPDAREWLLFSALCVSNAGIFLGFAVCAGSLAFWMREAEGASMQAFNMLVTFSTQPMPIFHDAIKLALLTVLPAGLLGFVPVEILRGQHLHWLLGHAGASISFLVLAAYVFERGLRRYASGNSLLVRT